MFRYCIAVLLFLPIFSWSQIDPKKLDLFSRAIDSSHQATRKVQDSFMKTVDSVYRSAQTETNKKNSDQSVKEEVQKKDQRQQMIVRIISVALLLVLAIVFISRRRKKT